MSASTRSNASVITRTGVGMSHQLWMGIGAAERSHTETDGWPGCDGLAVFHVEIFGPQLLGCRK